jgi:hypothetical protein
MAADAAFRFDDAQAVTDICRPLDRIPLAIDGRIVSERACSARRPANSRAALQNDEWGKPHGGAAPAIGVGDARLELRLAPVFRDSALPQGGCTSS